MHGNQELKVLTQMVPIFNTEIDKIAEHRYDSAATEQNLKVKKKFLNTLQRISCIY